MPGRIGITRLEFDEPPTGTQLVLSRLVFESITQPLGVLVGRLMVRPTVGLLENGEQMPAQQIVRHVQSHNVAVFLKRLEVFVA